ncbi:MAG: DUF1919 domain-containing protein [Selenomonadaceae bacterium]|nr:DUF1919 domain-containing protein [Selenomonadaceae bacterium]
MLKVSPWRITNDDSFFQRALNVLERLHGIEVVGADCDVVLVVGAKQIGMSEVVKLARRLNLPEDKLLGDWIVCVPGFTLDKYRKLQRSRLSIFAMNCFGGLISNMLGLPFRSPTVNMFFLEKEFVRFLRALRVYMEENLTLKTTHFDKGTELNYPVVTLGGVEIHMNHYRDFNEAVKIWNRRKARINWYNLFVTAYTESEDIAREFDALPFGKKVCFVPFKSDLDSAWHINPEIKRGLEFWDIVNHFGTGDPFYYDPFDMLLYGKKTPLIEM